VTNKIYRKCVCGETAHDLKYQLAREYGGPAGSGRFVYACRNCGSLAKDRHGDVKIPERAS
jgi:hypothetical protein